MTEQTCKDRIDQKFSNRIDDLRLLWDGYTNQDCPKCDGTGEIEEEKPGINDNDPYTELKPCEFCGGTGKLSENIPDLGTLDEYGLSFDYVAPHTFQDQPRGYFRYQLSWGGPSDEFRIFAEQISPYRWNVDRIEYWFLDWFDGAHKLLTGDDFRFIDELFTSFFVDAGSADAAHDEAMRDYEPVWDDDTDSDDDESDEDDEG